MKLSTTTALREAAASGVDMRLLEQLFDHTPDTAFFIKDAQGRYIAVNQSLLERHGLRSRAQMLGRRPSDVCPGDFRRIPAEQDAFVLRTGRPIVERLELQWYSPHQPVWCLTTKLPMRDASGAVRGIIGISKDVRSPVAPQEIPAGVEAALARLLRETERDVAAIALECGFYDHSAFTRAFRSAMSATPTEFRMSGQA